MKENYLWVEKYRPKRIDEYVFKDEKFKEQIKKFIDDKEIPHILLSGAPGTGKTTLFYILLNELDIDNGDWMKINSSNETGVDTMRNKITNFASTIAFGGMKYILLDEADYLTANSQALLRSLLEDFSGTCRFILTCNYPNKIIPAIKSRTQHFHIKTIGKDEFASKIVEILNNENVSIDDESSIDYLQKYIEKCYPDLRKCINFLQQNINEGKIYPLDDDESSSQDFMYEILNYLKENKINDMRKFIINNTRPEDYTDVFRLIYENIDIFDEERQNDALLIIRDGLYKHSIVADPEINLSATIVELENLIKEN